MGEMKGDNHNESFVNHGAYSTVLDIDHLTMDGTREDHSQTV